MIDITLDIENRMVVYPTDPAVRIKKYYSIKKGNKVNLSIMQLGSHTGTHIDAPNHFLDSGKTIDKISLDDLTGTVLVLEFRNVKYIDISDLKKKDLKNHKRILFKTKNSSYWQLKKFNPDYVYLTEEAASYLVSKKIKLVGIDGFSIERYKSSDCMVHKILLSNDIIIVESLNLRAVKQGEYELLCLPLKIKNGDGAPVRAVLR